jgi:eukaryotic-like serine/threonine-protein kinase
MLAGQMLRDRYKIVKLLGSGGFGDTYLAEDLDLPNSASCVVKHLKPKTSDPQVARVARRLFESEAQVLYRLGNECDRIPGLLAHFEENGEFYLVQELIDGEDLSSEISTGKLWPEDKVTQFLQEILEILNLAHKKGIVHRDLKPHNIMRRRQDGKIVLIDFGAVKEISTLTANERGETTATIAIGTPGYMPSEQSLGRPRFCSDLYAVGMLAIYALTGIPPYELPKDPTDGEVIWRNWAKVSDGLAEVLSKMVRYHFNQRYQTAAEVLQALNCEGAPSFFSQQTQPASNFALQPTRSLGGWSRRKVLQTLGLVGTGVGLAAIGQYLWPKDAAQKPSASKPSDFPLETFQFEVVTVDAKGNITQRLDYQAHYFTENLGNGIALEMVRIPGGSLTMGSPNTELQRDNDEAPQHRVVIPEFFIGTYEVTQAQYEVIMGKNPSHFKGANLPVENVSWNDAVEFCQRLSDRMGRTYRLPSEAEWEYACRGGTTTPFSFGETMTADLANFKGESTYAAAPKGLFRQKTTPVGSFPANALGLYDLHGNVYEWCQDYWHDSYEGAPTDGSAWLTGGDLNARVVRGGSWRIDSWGCRSASRIGFGERLHNDNVGFRVVV